MHNYISYHEVECYFCKQPFSREVAGKKDYVESTLERNQVCPECWENREKAKLSIIKLSKITGFITIRIYNGFAVKKELKETGYKYGKDINRNVFWEKILKAPSFDESIVENQFLTSINQQNQQNKEVWLKQINKELKQLLKAEVTFLKQTLPKGWTVSDDEESKRLFSLKLS